MAVSLRAAVYFQRKSFLGFLPQVIVTSVVRMAPFASRCIIFALALICIPVAARAATGVLTANTTQPLLGNPVTFTANLVPPVGAAGDINFGDGSPIVPVGPAYPASVVHTYSAAGEYLASFRSDASATVFLLVRVVLPTPRVPHGQIYSTVPLVSPVLAGEQTNILVTYSVVTPFSPFISNAPSLSAIVELLDDHDRLISRGDPVVIPYVAFLTSQIQTAHIPFAIPSDARGRYHVRVYLRVVDLGGTVAIGDPAPLVVVGGPDPQPQITSSIHANGSIEVGPSTGLGSTSGTSPTGAAQTTLNANLSLGLQNTTYTFTGATTLNPTSLRIDPLFTLVPGAQQVVSPNYQPPVSNAPATSASPLPHYQDMLGPVTAQLPTLLFSGGESLRGLDSIVNTGGWTYQAALGYPTVATSRLGGQQGFLFSFARPFSRAENLNLTFLQNVDDPYTFVPTNQNLPVNSRAGGIEFDQTFFSHLTLLLGAAQSGATPELGKGPTQSDAAEKAALSLTSGSDTFNMEWHNFGPNFAAGNGLGATSDSSGGSAQASLVLSRLMMLALNFAHNFSRSAVSGDTQEGATLTLSTPQSFQVVLTSAMDKTLATGANTTTRNYVVTLSKTGTVTGFNLNGTLATVSNALVSTLSGVTRSGTLQYTIMHGASNISFGVNGLENQVGIPSANVGESVVLSLPIALGRANQPAGATSFSATHGFELQFSASNTNQPSEISHTRDLIFGALLSYHLGSHVTLGLHGLTDRHTDETIPQNTATANTLRARMDVSL